MDARGFIAAVERYIARKDGPIPREQPVAMEQWKTKGLADLTEVLTLGEQLLPNVEPRDARRQLQRFLILLDKNENGDCWRPHWPSPSALSLWPYVEADLRITDTKTDSQKKTQRIDVPENPAVLKLAKAIKQKLGKPGYPTKKAVAAEFCHGNMKVADVLLRQLQPSRFGHLLADN